MLKLEPRQPPPPPPEKGKAVEAAGESEGRRQRSRVRTEEIGGWGAVPARSPGRDSGAAFLHFLRQRPRHANRGGLVVRQSASEHPWESPDLR